MKHFISSFENNKHRQEGCVFTRQHWAWSWSVHSAKLAHVASHRDGPSIWYILLLPHSKPAVLVVVGRPLWPSAPWSTANLLVWLLSAAVFLKEVPFWEVAFQTGLVVVAASLFFYQLSTKAKMLFGQVLQFSHQKTLLSSTAYVQSWTTKGHEHLRSLFRLCVAKFVNIAHGIYRQQERKKWPVSRRFRSRLRFTFHDLSLVCSDVKYWKESRWLWIRNAVIGDSVVKSVLCTTFFGGRRNNYSSKQY